MSEHATYEFECMLCGTRTWLSWAGGTLNECSCSDRTPDRLQVHRMLAGERSYLGSMAQVQAGG